MRDQATNLREKLNRDQDISQAKTIAIVSGKGGVGKSNVALNFAIELLHSHKRVLLFDLDVGMGNIDILLGQQPNQTVLDMLTEQFMIDRVITKGPNNLHYIAGGSSLTNIVTMDQKKMDYFLFQLQKLVPLYDHIIFDMGAGASRDNLAFILAADECMVVTTPEPTAITDAYGMIKHILNKQQNMPIYVVMNRTHTRKQGTKALERFRRIVHQFLHVTIQPMGVLPEDPIVQTAVIRQIPYVLLNDHAIVSKAMKQMTIHYLAETVKDGKPIVPHSFVQKIKRFLIER